MISLVIYEIIFIISQEQLIYKKKHLSIMQIVRILGTIEGKR